MNVGQITSLTFYDNEKFAIGKVLRGGMGVVYQLLPIRSDSPTIALKTLQEVMKEKDFERECESWLSIAGHKNVAHAFAFGKWEGLPAILINWYPKTMAEIKPAEINDEELDNLVEGIVSALSFAYDKVGMIHQDIKPANVLIDQQGNAKLSDFGLSRCSSSSSQMIPILYGNTSTATSGSMCGTPFFMAPEIFNGATPSIKTDIYSFGVTLYNFLTNEHPFIDPKLNKITLPNIRTGPLERLKKIRGRGFYPVYELIIKCISADPSQRPNTYKEILAKTISSTKEKNSNSDSLSDIHEIITKSMMFREQRNNEQAIKILFAGLGKYPDDPFLLNSLAILNVVNGKKEEGINFFKKAFKILGRTNGNSHNILFLEPGVNLAGQLLVLNLFSEAQLVLKTCWNWLEKAKSSEENNNIIKAYSNKYCEFGRMFLFDGDFQTTTSYLSEALSNKGADNFSSYALLEASWITNQVNSYADRILRNGLKFGPDDVLNWLAGCLVAQFANPQLKRKFYDSISPLMHEKIKEGENLAKVAPGSLLKPTHLDSQKFFIAELDNQLTGGKNIEHIRQIHKPRLV